MLKEVARSSSQDLAADGMLIPGGKSTNGGIGPKFCMVDPTISLEKKMVTLTGLRGGSTLRCLVGSCGKAWIADHEGPTSTVS